MVADQNAKRQLRGCGPGKKGCVFENYPALIVARDLHGTTNLPYSYLCGMKKFLKDLFAGQSYDDSNFFLVAGPCVVESEELVMEVADKVSVTCKNLGIPYIFKASYRKANRTSNQSFTGIGDEKALA